jgi:DNA-binding MarR family transcriptional regulator
VPQHSALLVLDDDPGISAAELARRCFSTPQTMTTILRNLETAGLIERIPHPRHRHVIETRPTPAGRKALEAADVRPTAVEARLAEAFTTEEMATLRDLLARRSEVLVKEVLRRTHRSAG